ncbi:SGNH/GDSL hydrolase family protein [Ancylobacter oerskovii]|nr:SGNH/GDSL hydrolase family protein [Ancylobacter oerskovii]
MKILVIGGSNSVMKPGYLSHTSEWLKKKARVAARLTNLSVGANNCLIGLENLKTSGSLEEFDKIVVEFAINDMSLATPEGFDTWQCAYEGLLRHILQHNARAQVFHLLLGRRSERYRDRTERIRAGMREIVRHYAGARDVRLLDFDLSLRNLLDNDQARISTHYKDEVHYDLEKGAPMLGRYVAKHLTAAPTRLPAPCPAPLHAQAFDRAVLWPVSEMSGDLDRRAFSNSRFARTGSVLQPARPLAVELPGPLICLSFLATADSRPLLLEEEGERPVLLHTAHVELVKTPEKFRIKNFTLDWKRWTAMERKGPRRVVLTALERTDVPRYEAFLVERFNMVPGNGEGGGPYVSNLAYLPPPGDDARDAAIAAAGVPAAAY